MQYTVEDGFLYYKELTEGKDYKKLFASAENHALLHSITEEQSTYRYAPGKWSIKQILGHIIDHERIMTYRILRFSKNDPTPLPGYDQNVFMENSRFDELPYTQLLDDFNCVRKSTISFIETLSPAQLLLTGHVWKFEMTVEDLLKATIGHELHHIDILKERYLQ